METNKLSKILYVEDDADIAMITTIILKSQEYEVEHCSLAIDALNMLEKFTPQLIISDVMMPNMDGVELFKKIKEQHADKKIPVIFMTAKAQIHEQEEYIKLGVLGVIIKPYEALTLCEKIEELWQSHLDESAQVDN